jgi:ParB family chromosome partitioning protein
MDIIEIATHLIDEDRAQPRYQFDEESLEELIKSIEELGLLSPIKVRTTKGGRYTIIYGNRRYKACKALEKPTIPCIVSNVTDELEIYLEQIAENLTREGFSPIEEAEAFNKLLTDSKFSSSVKYLSSKLGKPESYIKNKCELLKFSNAVKKLIVSGTEIRKDKLTELQLLPLKDLPLEHRDSLALMIAKDEMPVSDVKKIARLFKDKDISESTKAKLLYKSGHELIETWATFEQNKAQRSKPAPVKPEVKSEKVMPTGSNPPNVPTISPVEPIMPIVPTASAAEPNPLIVPTTSTVSTEVKEPLTKTAIERTLEKLLTSLPANNPIPLDTLHSFDDITNTAKESFIVEVDWLIESLELHLSEWHRVKALITAKSIASEASEMGN